VAWRRVRFWAAIAAGMTTQDAAGEAGVSSPVAYRWLRHAGGVNVCLPPTVSGATCRCRARGHRLLAGYDVGRDCLYGHIKATKGRTPDPRVLPISAQPLLARSAHRHRAGQLQPSPFDQDRHSVVVLDRLVRFADAISIDWI
jgi:hypothetical protein